MNSKLYIGVEVFGLLVQGVHVFTSDEKAESWFEGYTGINYKAYTEEVSKGTDSEAILGRNFDQTKLFEVKYRIEASNPLTKLVIE